MERYKSYFVETIINDWKLAEELYRKLEKTSNLQKGDKISFKGDDSKGLPKTITFYFQKFMGDYSDGYYLVVSKVRDGKLENSYNVIFSEDIIIIPRTKSGKRPNQKTLQAITEISF